MWLQLQSKNALNPFQPTSMQTSSEHGSGRPGLPHWQHHQPHRGGQGVGIDFPACVDEQQQQQREAGTNATKHFLPLIANII